MTGEMQVDAHILVVDDDERIRDLLKKFLSRHAYWVTTARDAAHARLFHAPGAPALRVAN